MRRPILSFQALVASLALALAACGGSPADSDRFPDTGHVIVSVHDTAGHPVANVTAELRFPDLQLVWRSGVTGPDGSVEIGKSDGGVLPGDYAVTVVLPAGATLAPGQAASTPVTVQSNRTVDVDVRLSMP